MSQTDRNNATTTPPSPPPQLQEAVDAAVAAQEAAEAAALDIQTNYIPKTGGVFTGDIEVPADPYNRTTWNSNNETPTKNDLRDKIEAMDYRFTTTGSSPTFILDGQSLFGNAYSVNERIRIVFNAGVSSGGSTLNRDSLGAKSIKQYDSTGSKVNPVILAGQYYEVEYDGTDYMLLNTANPVYSGALDLPGGQIKFPATQNASSDPNTLDDYEEGSWTPALATGTTSGASGRYIKIGRMVTAWFEVTASVQTNAADFIVTGAPFATNLSFAAAVSLESTETTATQMSFTSSQFAPHTAALLPLTVTAMSGDLIRGSASYQTAN